MIDTAELRAKIEHELDEMMMGAENYFGSINPKRAGHIHGALDRIMAWVAMRDLQGATIERLRDLLTRWVNIAENGHYGEHTKFPMKRHPIVAETLAALTAGEP